VSTHLSRIGVEQVGGVSLVGFVGRRIGSEQQVQGISDDLRRLVDGSGGRKFLLDFGNVESLSSAALGALIIFHQKVKNAQGVLVMCRLPASLIGVFNLLRVDRLFTIAGTAPAGLDDEIRAVLDSVPPVSAFTDWRTDTVLLLAKQMRDDRHLSAMPILADALQDAGCTNDELLSVCRSDAACVRRRWVLDLVLGKS